MRSRKAKQREKKIMSDEAKQKPKSSGELTMDFSAFILSLNASSLIHLGEIPDPQSRERTVNVSAAKHTIEILEILKEKTAGNLDKDENKLLDDILYNLRLKFLQHSKTQ
jgi:Domain of unknown function (DUF1844)